MTTVRIATRGSKLALWQAEHIKAELVLREPELEVELVVVKTVGDRVLDRSLAAIGGKGLFTKEVEEALLSGGADLAVHSLKDVPTEETAALGIFAFPPREQPWDALLCNPSLGLPRSGSARELLAKLPPSARLGTSSLRRACQLLALRPDLQIVPLRGNVDTRLRKLLEGELDAAVLAAAGLSRLGLSEHIAACFSQVELLPACGQGALAVQCRRSDAKTQARLGRLDHYLTRQAVLAERALNFRLGGSCQTPIAGYAQVSEGLPEQLILTAMVGSLDGKTVLRASAQGAISEPIALAESVAAMLLAQGAQALLRSDAAR
jgi:hydroxymethylbilane synthase